MSYKYITYIQLVRPQQQLKPKNKKRKAQNLKRFKEYTRIKLIFHFNFSQSIFIHLYYSKFYLSGQPCLSRHHIFKQCEFHLPACAFKRLNKKPFWALMLSMIELSKAYQIRLWFPYKERYRFIPFQRACFLYSVSQIHRAVDITHTLKKKKKKWSILHKDK